MKKSSKVEVKGDLEIYREKISGMKAMIDSSLVTNDQELEAIADKIKNVKVLGKLIKQKKEKYCEPAKAIIAEARETYDPLIKECENAEIVLKQRATVYMNQKEKERIEAEDKIANRVGEGKGKLKPETAMNQIEALPDAPKNVRTDNGSGLRMSKRKVAKIENPDLVPDEYWVIDEVRVRREALEKDKNNQPGIPGVVIVEESSLASI